MKPRIGITMGDPGGIGPEVVLKALSEPGTLSRFDPLLIGIPKVFEKASQDLRLGVKISLVRETRWMFRGGEGIPVLQSGDASGFGYGEPSAEGGESSFQAIGLAAQLALEGKIDAIVTAPISKYSLHLAGHAFPGHTELLSQLAKTEKYAMMLLSGDYRVVLVTTHLSLREVAESISEERVLETIELTDASLKHDFQLKDPRIGVCSLNPHGGEEGIFGDEEERTILPAISKAGQEGIRVEGPFASDTLFTRWKEFDSIVAMYHDQGLIPLKLLGFGRGVNLTLGLPFIRTSPDHGTAFDIAGKGAANPGSMVEAINLAAELSQR